VVVFELCRSLCYGSRQLRSNNELDPRLGFSLKSHHSGFLFFAVYILVDWPISLFTGETASLKSEVPRP